MTNKWLEREWWAALLPAIIGLLTVLGVIGADDNAVVTAVTGVVLIVGPAIAYIVARIWSKTAAIQADAAVKVEQAKSEAKIAIAEATTPPIA
jgi:uncharacterized membrane protein